MNVCVFKYMYLYVHMSMYICLHRYEVLTNSLNVLSMDDKYLYSIGDRSAMVNNDESVRDRYVMFFLVMNIFF
jgi:hypothetical protein